MTRITPPRGASLEELRAGASHAAQRVALYRRKVLLGRGDARRLAELERISLGAAARLERGLHGVRAEGDAPPLRYVLPEAALEPVADGVARGRETP